MATISSIRIDLNRLLQRVPPTSNVRGARYPGKFILPIVIGGAAILGLWGCAKKEAPRPEPAPTEKAASLPSEVVAQLIKDSGITEETAAKYYKVLEGGMSVPDYLNFLAELTRYVDPLLPHIDPPGRKIARKLLIEQPAGQLDFVIGVFLGNLENKNAQIQKEAKEALIVIGKSEEALRKLFVAWDRTALQPLLKEIFTELFKDEKILAGFISSHLSAHDSAKLSKAAAFIKMINKKNTLIKIMVGLLNTDNYPLGAALRKELTSFKDTESLFDEMKGKDLLTKQIIVKIMIEIDAATNKSYGELFKCLGDEDKAVADLAYRYVRGWNELFPYVGWGQKERIQRFKKIWLPEYKIWYPEIAEFIGLTQDAKYLPALEKALESGDEEVCKSSAQALAKFGELAAPVLVKKLGSDDSSSRDLALKTLKDVAQNTGQALDGLIYQNWKPEYPIYYYEAAKALNRPDASLGEEFIPAFVNALEGLPSLLAALKPEGKEITNFLSRRFTKAKDKLFELLDKTEKEHVRVALIQIISEQGSTIVPELVERMHKSPHMLRILQRISENTGLSLDDFIADNWKPNYSINYPEVAQALGNKGKAEFIPQLFGAIGTEEHAQSDIAQEAVKALNSFPFVNISAYLLEIAKGEDLDGKLRVLMFYKLSAKNNLPGHASSSPLIFLLDDGNETIIIEAQIILVNHIYADNVDGLIDEVQRLLPNMPLNYDKPIKSYYVLKAIGKDIGKDAITYYAKRLLLTAKDYNEEKHGPNSLEAVAHSLLIKYLNDAGNLSEDLREKVLDKHEDIEIRRYIARLFAYVRPREAKIVFEDILGFGLFDSRDDDDELCRIALEGLKGIKGN